MSIDKLKDRMENARTIYQGAVREYAEAPDAERAALGVAELAQKAVRRGGWPKGRKRGLKPPSPPSTSPSSPPPRARAARRLSDRSAKETECSFGSVTYVGS